MCVGEIRQWPLACDSFIETLRNQRQYVSKYPFYFIFGSVGGNCPVLGTWGGPSPFSPPPAPQQWGTQEQAFLLGVPRLRPALSRERSVCLSGPLTLHIFHWGLKSVLFRWTFL